MISQLLFIFIISQYKEIRSTKTYIIHGKYEHTIITNDNVQQRLAVNMFITCLHYAEQTEPHRFPDYREYQSQDQTGQKIQPQVNEGKGTFLLILFSLKSIRGFSCSSQTPRNKWESHILHLYNNTFWKKTANGSVRLSSPISCIFHNSNNNNHI